MIQIIDNNVSSTEGKYIQRKGSPFLGIRQSQALAGDTAADWMEVDEAPAYTEEQYKQEVARLIAERYDYSDELALINNASAQDATEHHREEYAAYMQFRQECKERAKANLTTRAAAVNAEDNTNI